MIEFKKILWPTDFSEPSYKALRTADDLALHFGAKLFLVHVIAPIPAVAAPGAPMAFNVPAYQKELDTDANKRLVEIQKNNISDKLESELIVRHGEASYLISETAQKKDVDLIVISTHGLTGWRHLVFGSVAEKVVRNAPCPVLTIRAREEEEEEEK
jgi:nucleotide-binding universal stress UspA family protein